MLSVSDYICRKLIIVRHVEPPSPILTNQPAAEPKSEDPLSDRIYMILNADSDDESERCLVCAWSARTGLSYIGVTGDTVS